MPSQESSRGEFWAEESACAEGLAELKGEGRVGREELGGGSHHRDFGDVTPLSTGPGFWSRLSHDLAVALGASPCPSGPRFPHLSSREPGPRTHNRPCLPCQASQCPPRCPGWWWGPEADPQRGSAWLGASPAVPGLLQDWGGDRDTMLFSPLCAGAGGSLAKGTSHHTLV